MKNMVEIEIEKNKFLIVEEEKAIELAVQEYFTTGKQLKINNKKFDIFNYGNMELALKMQ